MVSLNVIFCISKEEENSSNTNHCQDALAESTFESYRPTLFVSALVKPTWIVVRQTYLSRADSGSAVQSLLSEQSECFQLPTYTCTAGTGARRRRRRADSRWMRRGTCQAWLRFPMQVQWCQEFVCWLVS